MQFCTFALPQTASTLTKAVLQVFLKLRIAQGLFQLACTFVVDDDEQALPNTPDNFAGFCWIALDAVSYKAFPVIFYSNGWFRHSNNSVKRSMWRPGTGALGSSIMPGHQ